MRCAAIRRPGSTRTADAAGQTHERIRPLPVTGLAREASSQAARRRLTRMKVLPVLACIRSAAMCLIVATMAGASAAAHHPHSIRTPLDPPHLPPRRGETEARDAVTAGRDGRLGMGSAQPSAKSPCAMRSTGGVACRQPTQCQGDRCLGNQCRDGHRGDDQIQTSAPSSPPARGALFSTCGGRVREGGGKSGRSTSKAGRDRLAQGSRNQQRQAPSSASLHRVTRHRGATAPAAAPAAHRSERLAGEAADAAADAGGLELGACLRRLGPRGNRAGDEAV